MSVRYVRAKEVVAVRHPEHGLWVGLDPAISYRSDDVLVLKYPWAFRADEDRIPDQEDMAARRSSVEQTTRAPGERRGRR